MPMLHWITGTSASTIRRASSSVWPSRFLPYRSRVSSDSSLIRKAFFNRPEVSIENAVSNWLDSRRPEEDWH